MSNIDALFRLSLKAFIQNDRGEVLVVKEHNRHFWDLPGGGMEKGETIHRALSREIAEEIGFKGRFSSDLIMIDNPKMNESGVEQIKVVFRVTADDLIISQGNDVDEIAYMTPDSFRDSQDFRERFIYECSQRYLNRTTL